MWAEPGLVAPGRHKWLATGAKGGARGAVGRSSKILLHSMYYIVCSRGGVEGRDASAMEYEEGLPFVAAGEYFLSECDGSSTATHQELCVVFP